MERATAVHGAMEGPTFGRQVAEFWTVWAGAGLPNQKVGKTARSSGRGPRRVPLK